MPPEETLHAHPHPARALIERMIERRQQPGADLAAIDAEIWQRFGHQCAVLYTDLVGFSRQVETFGIIHFLQIIHASRRLLSPEIERFDGSVLKEEGDSLLIIYPDPVAALRSAFAMQQVVRAYSREKVDEERIELCVGLGWGRVLKIGEDDVFGSEVNAACKLGEDQARGGEILATEDFVTAVQHAGNWVCRPLDIEAVATRRAWHIEEAD